ncbi:menaquinone-dependent protoporphyrinogen IX oxidase [Natranaerovirga pectinivora]|uniref:Menaquinone-dependent protoporphyrinogen IX oxidase n=1 Tax=Natranaerovirga pectinivora TaxID=682400 RepID=A0A4R3MRH4_9FIRM|nr:flavodoxin domain-containing protein [Natranaerovirga pectinivora]TCT15377.1 menaquinone-dependent protoporphyrinogen IX oxidase [Natranaerovirga pectinivora]
MKEKTVILYKTKYGSSKKYAQWISEEVNCEVYEVTDISTDQLIKYNTIVFVGPLYAVGILGFSKIKKKYSTIKNKKVIVVSVGASPAHPEAVNDIINGNFTNEMKERVEFFHLRGAFNFNKLNRIDKFMMALLKIKLKRKREEDLTNDEKGMLASYSRPVDWTNKKAIIPIIESIMRN